ncbi:hemagglutinin repeat-containing protein [Pseudomonas sp. RP23018S]|uniref:hemagglutinin repeat-containing protein n=1 Tax=Pseudomonas sp. RP23018S TaxID=3096037 RepID=UPI002ACAF792|nr:hemagglutinin repeat-containing protein [Pseudomonas sp. RP23018S]MDZ5603486.1 hemagglutinin repeat-containing protein [Pseudomonas sp. RP23018S]
MNEAREPSARRPDILRWTIFLCLASPGASVANDALHAATGLAGTPLIDLSHGVPVIDIVAPNGHGLSHNQFLDYNVGQPGVVLNNALSAGQSQLAGALAGNAQFQGQAASTILNEVISRNASLVNGPQEIFGRPADYILANPNGITVNGGRFINTTRAGFLVGTPIVEEQQLKRLDTFAASGQLQVLEGGLRSETGLDLIAPKVISNGPLETPGELNVLVGRNRLDRQSLEVLEHRPGEPGSIDASLFGAMHAGRIRIISTAEGAGVRMGPSRLVAGEELTVRSAGGLTVEGTEQRKSHLQVERGDMTLQAAHDLRLSAVTGSARSIDLNAGQALTLDGKTREKITQHTDSWDKKLLFVTHETYGKDTTTTQRTHHGVMLSASDDITLRAAGDMTLTGAKVEATDQLRVEAGGNLQLSAAVDSHRVESRVRHRKHLWRGDKDSDSYVETADPSSLKGGDVQLAATGDMRISASQVDSQRSLQIDARHLEIDAQHLNGHDTLSNYRGDLVSGRFFANRNGHENRGGEVIGSSVKAGGLMKVTAQRATIRGSEVLSGDDAVLYSQSGLLQIGAAVGDKTRKSTRSDSQVFGLLGDSSEQTRGEQQVLSSDVHSRTNLRLASAGEMAIEGARISAAQKLDVEAAGNLSISSAASHHTLDSIEQQRGLTAHAEQTREAEGDTPGSRQFDAGVGYDVATVERHRQDTRQTASELKGGSVDLRSGEALKVMGSKVTAEQGDLTLTAKTVEVGVTRNDTQDTTTRTESGGGLHVTGGIDRVGSAFNGKRNQTTTEHTQSKVQRSELQAAGDVKVQAETLVNEAAVIEPGKTFKVVAEHVDNRAADDTETTDTTTRNWSGSLGASVEYRDLTRPIERLVQGEEAARFQQASTEDAMAPPSVGADATFAHQNSHKVQTQSTAQVTAINSGDIQIKAQTVSDVGTTYGAGAGKVTLDAEQHQMHAAHDRHTVTEDALKIDASLRLDTSTGQDINARITGAVAKDSSAGSSAVAQVGSLQGQTGIQVQLGSDGRYEGTRMDGGSGPILIDSKGSLTVNAAADTQEQTRSELDASLWAKGGNRPGKTGLDVRGYGDYSSAQSSDSTAKVAQLDAQGPVTLRSGGDLLLEGVRIGRREAPVSEAHLESAGVLKDVAAYDTHQAQGSTLGGGMEVAGSQGASSGGGLGGHLTSAKVDEDTRTAQAPSVHTAGTLGIASQAREDQAIHLQGLQVSAHTLKLDARKGGLLVEASENREQRDNLAVTGGAGFNLSKAEKPADDVRGLHGRVTVDLDKRNNQTWNDGALRADQVSVNSAGNARFEGVRVEAEQIRGAIDGDLQVASRLDHIDTTQVKVDARLSHEKNPQGYINAATAVAGPAGGKVEEKAGSALGKLDPGLSPTLRIDASHIASDTVAQQSGLKGSQGIAVAVAGDTQLIGARLQAPRGSVELGSGSIRQQTLHGQDYRRDVSIDASNSLVDMGTAVAEISKSKGAADGENALDLGLMRTSGHSRDNEWKAAIQQKSKL